MLYIYLSMKVPKVKFIINIIIIFKNTVNTSGINNLIQSYNLILNYVYRLIFYHLKYC